MAYSIRALKTTRPSIDRIVIDELQNELDEIISYRMAVASGIEDYVHPVLDDSALTDAMQKVIEYYNTKLEPVKTSYDSDDAYSGNIQDGFDFGRD
jgi:hypothetical protein